MLDDAFDDDEVNKDKEESDGWGMAWSSLVCLP